MANWNDLFGGGVLPQLAPDLTYPSNKAFSTTVYNEITGIDASGSLTVALSLTGKFTVSYLVFEDLTSEQITIKLTIDGDIVWNDTFTSGASQALLGNTTPFVIPELYMCKSSFLLEVQTLTDTNISLIYQARPIL